MSFSLLAPAANQLYKVRSGNSYTSNGSAQITVTDANVNDLKDLLNNGCQLVPAGSANGTIPGAVAAYISAAESSDGFVHRTVLTVTALPQTVVNGTEYQSTEIYDFPEGRILVLGVLATIAQTTTSALASTLNASSTGALSLGSVAASNVSLTSTMVDLMPSTAFTSSATINVAGTAVSAALAASAQFDGTTTAKKMFINTAYATTTDVDGDATQTLTGTVQITWILLGDY